MVKLLGVCQDITEQKMTQMLWEREAVFLELLKSIAIAANEAKTIRDSLEFALSEILKKTGWDIAHALLTNPANKNEFVSTGIWCAKDNFEISDFKKATESIIFTPEIGIVGKTVSLAAPVWIENFSLETEFPRKETAKKYSLRSALAVPVLVESEIAGVLEFYSTKLKQPDEKLINVLSLIGVQLGRVIERRRSEKAILHREMKFRSLAETANDAIITADSNNNIIFFNSGAEKMFGIPSSQAEGKPLTILMPERYVSLHLNGFEKYKQTGQGKVIGRTVELTGKRSSGDEFPIELSINEWKTAEGTFFTGIIRDITERKRAEEHLKLTNEKLKQAQQDLIDSETMAVVGRFASGIAHEIRNPLANISASAQYSLSKFVKDSDERLKQYLEIIIRNAETANRIIKELLNYSSPKNFNFGYCSIDKVIKKSVSLAEGRCKNENIKLTVNIEDNLPEMNISKEKLEEAFSNFISNSIDAMPDGGELNISAAENENGVKIVFEDTGLGIADENLSKIKEPFFTTKSNGTGLGLSLAHKIISSHKGSFDILSTQGKGTKVIITIPNIKEEAKETAAA